MSTTKDKIVRSMKLSADADKDLWALLVIGGRLETVFVEKGHSVVTRATPTVFKFETKEALIAKAKTMESSYKFPSMYTEVPVDGMSQAPD